MLFEIKHRLNGSVLFSLECASLKLCVEAAIGQKADLSYANLSSADLSSADLSSADLSSANLSSADLSYANLRSADLSSADLDDASRLETGETFAEYKRDVLPVLMTAGGKTVEQVAAAWDCHEWANCPMQVAFDFNGDYANATPLIRAWRPRIEQFVKLFDAKLLPNPCGEAAACNTTVESTTN